MRRRRATGTVGPAPLALTEYHHATMTTASIILTFILAGIASAVLLGMAVRSVWREMKGLGDGDDAEAGRDADTIREIERWREGK